MTIGKNKRGLKMHQKKMYLWECDKHGDINGIADVSEETMYQRESEDAWGKRRAAQNPCAGDICKEPVKWPAAAARTAWEITIWTKCWKQ